jgi:hypothetical protein
VYHSPTSQESPHNLLPYGTVGAELPVDHPSFLKIKTILKNPLLIAAETMAVDAAAVVAIDEDEVMNMEIDDAH